MADELRRSRPRISDIAAMAENFELAGDLEQAHRWAAMGVNRLDLDDAADTDVDYEVVYLLDVRRRIRQALGFRPTSSTRLPRPPADAAASDRGGHPVRRARADSDAEVRQRLEHQRALPVHQLGEHGRVPSLER